jgi:hypothetical protein
MPCSTSGWIHTPEPMEMHTCFPFVLHASTHWSLPCRLQCKCMPLNDQRGCIECPQIVRYARVRHSFDILDVF